MTAFLALAIGLVAVPSAYAADSVPPVVGTPSTGPGVTAGSPTTFTLPATDNDAGVDYCYLIVDLTALSTNMIRTTGTDQDAYYSQSYTFPFGGTYTVAARCVDREGNIGTSANRTVSVLSPEEDASGPLVGTVSPDSATVGTPVTFSASYADNVGVVQCQFGLGTGTFLEATRSGSPMSGTASYTYSFSSPGTFDVTFRCTDARGNPGIGIRRVTVMPAGGVDATAPVVGTLSPLSATVGTPVTFSASYSDDVGVGSCFLYVDGETVGMATLTGTAMSGTASRAHTFTTAGAHTASIFCKDAALNSGDTGTRTITVAAASVADTLAPTFSGAISPLTATVGVPVTLSLAYADNVGVTECYLYVDGALAGGSSSGGASGTTSRSHAFATAGAHAARFQCRDAAGNTGVSTTYTVNVAAASGAVVDRVAPTVSAVTTAPVSVNTSVRYTATVSDADSGIARCELFVNGTSQGLMDLSGATAARTHSFGSAGTYSVYVSCWDRAGNGASGPVVSVSVTSGTSGGGAPGGAPAVGLVKATCPAYAVAADHPCRAVYYNGQDGRRHAFPNERVYFTWYRDFSGVREISDSALAAIPLGRNVTYRPGSRLVKFTTLNRVYAVARGGILRWVTTEAVARDLYGAAWATQVDDISDVFFTNYAFGADITAAGQFVPSVEAGLAVTIDQNW